MRNLDKPTMVVAIVALIAALAGGAYAATKIGTEDLERGAVTGKKIRNGAVGTGKIRKAAVTAAKMATASVNAAAIKDGSVSIDEIADDAVGSRALAGILRRSNQSGIDNGSVGTVSAECNEDEQLIGGGGAWAGSDPGLILRSSAPSANARSWVVQGQNASGGLKQLQAHALCLANTPAPAVGE